MKRFVEIFDFELPHNTGLVFEIDFETDDRFWVKDIVDDDGNVFSTGGWLKSLCFELKTDNYNYCNILLERTKTILNFQKDK
jgi:hypothetical protein